MSSIRQLSQVELTRLHSIASRLGDAWGALSTQEALERALCGDAFVKNPALVSSFGADSAVLLHMVSMIKPDAQVIFLDTGFHFPETLVHRNQLVEKLGLKNVRSASVDPIAEKRLDARRRLHLSNPDSCCQLRKVSVLDRHLRMNDAWISGQRRSQSMTRSSIAMVEVDEARGKLKLNPLANWSHSDIAAYKAEHALPEHPLVAKGFPSIGCQPCTSAIKDGEDQRAGRWRSQQKLECGLHNRPNIIASSEYVA
ncbi:thioredoxin-dependent phosophoadenylyl-sulfate reductase [gamma proteobacterium HIMB55]|nr:thioredoxin-dependent phosophoadenylyl-sulfate reductase [gamma proteobacterium HIMB55]